MYLIKDPKGRYLKTTINKMTFITNEILADTFRSQREATDYIRKRFNKKSRRFYKPVYISDVKEPLSSIKTNNKINQNINSNIDNINWFDKTQQQINTIIQQQLNPLIEHYRLELIQYDNIILDLRHYIRDENTKANACWGYMVFKAMQDAERQRVERKKEYQRILLLKTNLEKSITTTQEFEYEPYKYRVISDIEQYIKNPKEYRIEVYNNENI